MKNKVKTHSLRGNVEVSSTTAEGKEAVIKFSYGWDFLDNEPEFYDDGSVIVEGHYIAGFSYRMFKMSITTEDYSNMADYASMIGRAIAELEQTIKSKGHE